MHVTRARRRELLARFLFGISYARHRRAWLRFCYARSRR